ncbi:MAG: hypothetical protein PHU33_06770 [Bacteroidales bacterium]|nr:hypothetical protein [Bacteroidales bacterium]
MKKLLAILVLLTTVSLAIPKNASADTPCIKIVITCCDGSQHMAIACTVGDIFTWKELLCSGCANQD